MSGGTLLLTILGSGTSTGVPVVGCSCAVCTSGTPRNIRTRCSALLTYGGRNILIDTATDLRTQMLREKVSRIDAVLFTHTHADHLHGIDDLRPFSAFSGKAIPVFGSARTITAIRRNFGYIFDDEPEPGYRPRLITRTVSGPFDLFGLPIEPLPLVHGRGESLGFRVGALAYLTDCNAIPEKTERRLRNLDVLIIDALRFRPHTTHFNIRQALDVAARLEPRRTVLTHLGHDVDHHRHGAELPAGAELAFDGQRIEMSI